MKRYSIIQKDMSRCFICGRPNTHIHEVFFGKNRQNSIEYGCCVGLCPFHHNASSEGVHYNSTLDKILKEMFQREFIKLHSEEEFMKIFKRNYM